MVPVSTIQQEASNLLPIAMHMKLPQYTKSDLAIMLLVVVPWLLGLNRLIVGALYFNSFLIFLIATIVTFLVMSISWQVHTLIAVVIRERFPNESQTSLRLGLSIPIFILITALILTLLFWGYDTFHFPGADFDRTKYHIALLIGGAINVFVTFLHEGIMRFEKWKAVLVENEQLKKEYMQSQLLGLKSQINPHFLFNSLNSLSSLINEDEKEAEVFLDEMSKVYRYLLRSNDDELVSLHTELDFIRSFYYLMKTRYGRGVELHIDVDNEETGKCIPPLTLQMLLEDVFNCNVCSRDNPIIVTIKTTEAGLEIRNNINKKALEDPGVKENLENVKNKFWLLCQKQVEVDETEHERLIRIPLIIEKRDKAA